MVPLLLQQFQTHGRFGEHMPVAMQLAESIDLAFPMGSWIHDQGKANQNVRVHQTKSVRPSSQDRTSGLYFNGTLWNYR